MPSFTSYTDETGETHVVPGTNEFTSWTDKSGKLNFVPGMAGGGYVKGSPNMMRMNPYIMPTRNLGGMVSSIAPTVKKAKVYDSRTGELIQNDDPFTADEIAQGAGTFPGGLRIQPGTGSGSPDARIGNKGGVMAPPSPNALEANGRSGMGSLDDFYAARAVDPTTGLHLNPSAHEIAQQRAQLSGAFGNQPNFHGLMAADRYYQGRRLNNPYITAEGRGMVQDVKSQQNVINKMVADAQAAAANKSLQAGGAAMSNPGILSGALGATNPLLGGIAALQGLVPGRAHGGQTKEMNPYMVGEKGPEVFVPKHGKPEVVGAAGPEIRTFKEDGEIIPNDQVKAMAGGGEASGSKYAFTLPPSMPYYTPPPNGNTGRMAWNLGANLNPFMHPVRDDISNPPPTPTAYTPIQSDDSSLWGEDTPDAFNPLVQPPPGKYEPSGPGWLNPYLSALGSVPTTPPAVFAEPANAVQRMTSIPGVRSLSPIQSTEQSFLTPYGKVGVSYGQPKNEGMIEGLPASEWFQRAANRQGEENKYAKVEKGYETAAQKKERERSNLKKAGVS